MIIQTMKVPVQEVAQQPQSDNEGIKAVFTTVIQKQWDVINDLNSIIATLPQYGYEEMVPVLEQTLLEANKGVGEIQCLLDMVSAESTVRDVAEQEVIQIVDEQPQQQEQEGDVIVIGEAYKNSNKYTQRVEEPEEKGELEESLFTEAVKYLDFVEPSQNYTDQYDWFVTYYEESDKKVSGILGFNSYEEARKYLNEIKDKLKEDGYEKRYNDFFLKSSPTPNRDSWVKIESSEDVGKDFEDFDADQQQRQVEEPQQTEQEFEND